MKKVSIKCKKESKEAMARRLRDDMFFNRGGIDVLDKMFELLSRKKRDAVTCLENVGLKYSSKEKWKGMVYREKLEALSNLIKKR